MTASGVISGAGALTKAGTGTLTLSGANTFSGGVLVNSGTLAAGNGAADVFGSGTINVGASGIVSLPYNLTVSTVPNAFSGSGTVNYLAYAANQNFLSGDWSGFSGTLNLSSSTSGGLNFTGSNLGSSTMTLNAGAGTTVVMQGTATSAQTVNIGQIFLNQHHGKVMQRLIIIG